MKIDKTEASSTTHRVTLSDREIRDIVTAHVLEKVGIASEQAGVAVKVSPAARGALTVSITSGRTVATL